MFRNSRSKEDIDPSVEIVESVLFKSPKTNTLVGAIDQGTSSSRFLVVTPKGEIAAWAQMEHQQIYPSGEDKVGFFVVVFGTCMFCVLLRRMRETSEQLNHSGFPIFSS